MPKVPQQVTATIGPSGAGHLDLRALCSSWPLTIIRTQWLLPPPSSHPLGGQCFVTAEFPRQCFETLRLQRLMS